MNKDSKTLEDRNVYVESLTAVSCDDAEIQRAQGALQTLSAYDMTNILEHQGTG